MELVLKDMQSALTVSETTFDRGFSETLVHQVVVAYAASVRQSIRTQKTCAEVTGSSKGPWRQKDADRAHSGSIRSPVWCSGGVTFAARSQGHSQKANKKIYRGALKSILSELVRQDCLIVVEELSVEAPKTRLLVQELKNMTPEDVLIITDELNESPFLTTRNLHKVDVHDATGIDPANLVAFDKVITTTDAARQVEGMLT